MKSVSHWGMHPDEDELRAQREGRGIIDDDFDEDAETVIDMLCLRGRIIE